jgi:nucleotide-binding universal stress UspA family protein
MPMAICMGCRRFYNIKIWRKHSMLPDINKILYATDLSKNSAHAFRYAVYFAKKFDAEIIILHIIEGASPNAVKALTFYLKEEYLKEILEDGITHRIERIKSRLRIFSDKELADDLEFAQKITSIEVHRGFPEEEILKKADDFNCDAIIMGSHEKGVTQTFLGTVAKRVLRRSRKPVFIIPLPKGEIDTSFDDDD